MTTIHIAHLFPRELGINGDVGNVTTLSFRARAYGLNVIVHDVHRGAELPPEIDIVHIGSGPIAELSLVLPELRRHAPTLRDWRDDGVPFLAISAGWFGLGNSVQWENGDAEDGAGIFPTSTTIMPTRAVGEVLLETKWGLVAGFENHSSKVDDGGLEHFGRVTDGVGSDPSASKTQRWDGVILGASIATNVHGSLLPMNPALADHFITAAMVRRVPGWSIPETDVLADVNRFAELSREAIVQRLH